MRLARIEKTIATAMLSAAAMLVGTPDAKAEAPAGEYVVVVAPEPPVMLARGAAQMCQSEPQGEICVSTTASSSLGGSIYGNGTVTLTGKIEGVLPLAFSGRLRGAAGKPTARMVAVARGPLSDGSMTVDADGEGRITCKLSVAEVDRFDCKARLRVCGTIDGRNAGCTRLVFPLAMGAEKAPPWRLTIALEDAGTGKVSGSAVIQDNLEAAPPFPSGGTLQFNVKKGRYSPTKDTASIAFRPWYADQSNKLALKNAVFEAGTLTRGEIVFNLAGQKGRYTIAP